MAPLLVVMRTTIGLKPTEVKESKPVFMLLFDGRSPATRGLGSAEGEERVACGHLIGHPVKVERVRGHVEDHHGHLT